MFAVIRSGGKQYRVSPEDVIRVERLVAEAGQSIELTDVLAMGEPEALTVGTPLVEGARVAATVVEHTRADKIIVFRKQRRKNYRRKRGHRQHLTVLRIDEILAAGQERSKKKAVEAKAPAKPKTPAKAKPPAKAKTAAKAPAKAKTAAKPKAEAPAKAEPAAKGKSAASGAAKPKTAAAKKTGAPPTKKPPAKGSGKTGGKESS